MPKDLGSNPSECHIFYLFRCVLSFSASLAKRWKVQFRMGLAKTLNNIDSNNGIQISKKEYHTKEIESTVDIYRNNTVNKKEIYIYMHFFDNKYFIYVCLIGDAPRCTTIYNVN